MTCGTCDFNWVIRPTADMGYTSGQTDSDIWWYVCPYPKDIETICAEEAIQRNREAAQQVFVRKWIPVPIRMMERHRRPIEARRTMRCNRKGIGLRIRE